MRTNQLLQVLIASLDITFVITGGGEKIAKHAAQNPKITLQSA